jgi:adenylate cyclase
MLGSRTGMALLAALAMAVLVLLSRGSTALQTSERIILDRLVAGRAVERDARVTVIEIREEDIQRHWPIDDAVLARALERVLAAGPRAVGLALFRDLPVEPGSRELSQLLAREPRIVGVEAAGVPPPPALAATDRVGFADVLPDSDGVVRRALLFQDDGVHEVQYSLPLRLALAYLAADHIHPQPAPGRPDWLALGPVALEPLDPDFGAYRGLDAGGYQIMPARCRTERDFDRVAFGALLDGTADPALLRGRIALLGHTSPSVARGFNVACARGTQPVAGVMLHAGLASELIAMGQGAAHPLRATSEPQEIALIAALAGLGAVVGIRMRGPAGFALAALVAPLLLLGLAWLCFARWLWLPVAGPSLAWVGALALAGLSSLRLERAERGQLMRLFSLTQSEPLAEELWRRRAEFLDEGRPQARPLDASVLFVDIRDFTGVAARLQPEQLMQWVNETLAVLASHVRRSGGIVDDYFGDGLKANFGVPFPRATRAEIAADARAAVGCARGMEALLRDVNARHRALGYPQVEMRVGIHSGPVVLGAVGSEARLKMTSVGQAVVVAQRLEALADVEHDFQRSPVRILISRDTRALLDDSLACERLGVYPLKGLPDPVEVYRVVAAAAPERAC